MNEFTNRWNTCRIKDTRKYPDIWFNKLNNLKFKFNRIKEEYEKYEDTMKAYAFEVLPEEFKPVRVSRNVKISKMA